MLDIRHLADEILQNTRDWLSSWMEQVADLLGQGDFLALETSVGVLADRFALRLFERMLEMADDALMQTRDRARYELVGKRERTLVTSRGELHLKCRIYRDRETGTYAMPLDALLGLCARERLSPKVRMHLVELAATMSYHQAARTLSQFMPQVSAMRVWQEMQRMGARLDEAVQAKREARYAGHSERTKRDAERKVAKLYVEADGMWVRARGPKRHAEVKIVLAYEGKQVVGRDRRKLVGRQVVAGVVPGEAVWEEAVGAFSDRWDLDQVCCSVVGTDGAAWAKQGVDVFPNAVHRLDLYHLYKHLRMAFGVEKAAYEEVCAALECGDWTEVEAVLRRAERVRRGSARERVRALRQYLRANWEGIRRDGAAESLGAMEGQVFHQFARRMKRHGGWWSEEGAHRLARVLAARASGQQLTVVTTRETHERAARRAFMKASWAPAPAKAHEAAMKTAQLPALYGPHVSRVWVKYVLRALTRGPRF
ncbi:MAG: ISLre2 family transposase [Alicyclobacillus sp.]|nr:ISLre2 family transposase [Alicyclobacillus sp.]